MSAEPESSPDEIAASSNPELELSRSDYDPSGSTTPRAEGRRRANRNRIGRNVSQTTKGIIKKREAEKLATSVQETTRERNNKSARRSRIYKMLTCIRYQQAAEAHRHNSAYWKNKAEMLQRSLELHTGDVHATINPAEDILREVPVPACADDEVERMRGELRRKIECGELLDLGETFTEEVVRVMEIPRLPTSWQNEQAATAAAHAPGTISFAPVETGLAAEPAPQLLPTYLYGSEPFDVQITALEGQLAARLREASHDQQEDYKAKEKEEEILHDNEIQPIGIVKLDPTDPDQTPNSTSQTPAAILDPAEGPSRPSREGQATHLMPRSSGFKGMPYGSYRPRFTNSIASTSSPIVDPTGEQAHLKREVAEAPGFPITSGGADFSSELYTMPMIGGDYDPGTSLFGANNVAASAFTAMQDPGSFSDPAISQGFDTFSRSHHPGMVLKDPMPLLNQSQSIVPIIQQPQHAQQSQEMALANNEIVGNPSDNLSGASEDGQQTTPSSFTPENELNPMSAEELRSLGFRVEGLDQTPLQSWVGEGG